VGPDRTLELLSCQSPRPNLLLRDRGLPGENDRSSKSRFQRERSQSDQPRDLPARPVEPEDAHRNRLPPSSKASYNSRKSIEGAVTPSLPILHTLLPSTIFASTGLEKLTFHSSILLSKPATLVSDKSKAHLEIEVRFTFAGFEVILSGPTENHLHKWDSQSFKSPNSRAFWPASKTVRAPSRLRIRARRPSIVVFGNPVR
jgi:hypothetical protein